ncbi:hypothetical protein BC826DRAFT_1043678 [Russula brevipes]|nr:hypothetical protein BC826DRAFT_1043678 [Russula brevipes]
MSRGGLSEVESSSSSDRFESIPGSLKSEKSRRRDRRVSPPTDSEDEDPFYFDNILSSPSRTLSSSLLRPRPHRFSLLRERASEETIFVQEICDAEGRRWSLRVPASGLPEDMVHMLEELEKLAVELGQALPKIVVTCSAESLSLKRMERDAAINASGLLRPPPAVGDESSAKCGAGIRRSFAEEKRRLVEPERASEEPAPVSSASEQSLRCIYLPELAPEFLSGSSTSPVLQPADGFHSKPTQAIQCPRQRAFFSALKDKEPQLPSGIAKRLASHSTTAEAETGAVAVAATPSAKSKSRAQAAKSKSALPIRKANAKSMPAAAADDRRRARWASLPGSPPLQPEGPRMAAPGILILQQQPPSAALDHVSRTRATAGATMVPSGAGISADAGTDVLPAVADPPSSWQPPNRIGSVTPTADTLRTVTVSAPAPTPVPATGRKLRHLFRRPPVRSASDPPVYSYSARLAVDGVKRPASEVVPVPREVVERRMPRLPSARDLLRKLT